MSNQLSVACPHCAHPFTYREDFSFGKSIVSSCPSCRKKVYISSGWGLDERKHPIAKQAAMQGPEWDHLRQPKPKGPAPAWTTDLRLTPPTRHPAPDPPAAINRPALRPPQPAGTAETETRIFTVHQDEANQEIQFRQQWGWRLASTAARSYMSGGTYTGVGFGNSITGQVGTIQGNTHHKTDLVMTRLLYNRGRQLRDLEVEYESLVDNELDSGVTIVMSIGAAIVAFAPFYVVEWFLRKTMGETPLELTIAWVLIIAWLVLAALWIRRILRRNRSRKQENEYNRVRRRQILVEARQIKGAHA